MLQVYYLVKIIADKPNQVNRENLDLERREKAIPEDIKDKIKQHLFRIPSEKYEFPMTSSHDFGWEKGEKLNRNQRRFPKVGCDVTRYADEYYALKGRSPYSTREIVKDNRKQ